MKILSVHNSLCFTYNEEGRVKTLRELIALSNKKKTINPKYTFFFLLTTARVLLKCHS